MSTGLIYHEAFLSHDTGPTHPERPARLRAVIEALEKSHLLAELRRLPFGPAEVSDLETLHEPRYVRRVLSAAEYGEGYVDSPECAVSMGTAEAARLAAGGVFAAVDAVMAGEVDNAFCAVRPPGHHAEHDHATGFCFFNHIALAAERLIRRHGLERVAVVDFDVHHGNGTQHLFERRGDVLFCSIHEHPMHLYPGTGFSYERGEGGKGRTSRSTCRWTRGRGTWTSAGRWCTRSCRRSTRLSRIFSWCRRDSTRCATIRWPTCSTRRRCSAGRRGFLKKQAERHCGGRLVSVLEGGYDLRALGECATLHVQALAREGEIDGTMAMKAGM